MTTSKYNLEAIRQRIRYPGWDHYRAYFPLAPHSGKYTEIIAVSVFNALKRYHKTIWTWLDEIASEVIAATGDEPDYHEYRDTSEPWLRLDHPRPDSREGVWFGINFEPDVLRLFCHLLDSKGRESACGRHEFDYADPDCFEKLAAVLAGYGVALDLEALS